MTHLFEIGLTNAVVAALLAVLVWSISRMWRHPALVHALWVVVLIKLITPPMFSVPWPLPHASFNPRESLELVSRPIPKSANDAMPSGEVKPDRKVLKGSTTAAFPSTHLTPATEPSRSTSHVEPQVLYVADDSPREMMNTMSWISVVIVIWLAGSAGYVILTIVRLARFQRTLAGTTIPNGELSRWADDIATTLGVSRRFRLRVTDGRISPLVWPVGRPTILLPRVLLDEMSESEVRSLLAHEMAHLRRRDHWVRWLELLVSTLYWWHPVVWWARKAMQTAEEQACDAWVVAAFPDMARQYADALFKAAQFSTENLAAIPAVASGVTSGSDLKRRIDQVLNAKWDCKPSRPLRLFAILFTVTVLPISVHAVLASEQESPEANSAPLASPVTVEETADEDVAESAFPLDDVDDEAETDPKIEPGAVLKIQVAGTPTENPIDAIVRVEPRGTVPLGPLYGRVDLSSMTISEAEDAVAQHLKTILKNPRVQITWANEFGNQTEPAHLAHPTASPEELEVMQELVGFLQTQFNRVDAKFRTGSADGTVQRREEAACELAMAKGELALAKGQREYAVAHFKDALERAVVALEAANSIYQTGRLAYDRLLEAAKRRAEIQRKLIQLQGGSPAVSTSSTQVVVDPSKSMAFLALARQRPLPVQVTSPLQLTESLGVLKKIAEHKKNDYERMQRLSQSKQASDRELAAALAEYELSIERIRQAKIGLRYYQKAAAVAQKEYEWLQEANKIKNRAVPETELELAKLRAEQAKILVEAFGE